MSCRKLLVVLFFLICQLNLFAQKEAYKFIRVEDNTGLSYSQINCILKDSQEYMWFGTMTGLSRYDGYAIKTFQHNAKDSTSINDNRVKNIYEGPDGLLWALTATALNIYNPQTETFYSQPQKVLKKYGIPAPSITSIVKDFKGNYWFLTPIGELFKYATQNGKTTKVVANPTKSLTSVRNKIVDFKEDKYGDFWLMYANGELAKLSGTSYQITYRNYFLRDKQRQNEQEYALFIDDAGDCWINPKSDYRGVFYFNHQSKQFSAINKNSVKPQLNTDVVSTIAQDNEGLIWIATDHGGINIINKKDFSVRYLLHNPDDEKSLSQNSIYALYKDNTGIMWVGTFKDGVHYYHPYADKFRLYKHQANNSFSLQFNDVNRFVEDAKGNLWIGTNGGGLLYFDRQTGQFKQYLHNPNDPKSLSNNIIVGLYLDQEQILWIGTYMGGLNKYDGKEFTRYRHDPKVPASLADDRVWDILEDSQKNLWIATLGGGLDQLDRQTNTFRHYKPGSSKAIHSLYINQIMEDNAGYIWLATANGLEKMNRETGVFTNYINQAVDPKGAGNNSVSTLLEDSRGFIWCGTDEGLHLFNKSTQAFKSFRKADGLPDNSVMSIVEDNQHNLWLSTRNGLSNLIIKKESKNDNLSFSFKNYDKSDGLQDVSFNTNAGFKTRSGELVFGGGKGINIFDPQSLAINKIAPKVILTGLQLFNQNVEPNKKVGDRVIISQPISQIPELRLKYHENMFSLSFAALNYLLPDKNQFYYKLEGFNDNWLRSDGKSPKATFTNLNPGTYIFRVKGSNNDGVWNENGVALKIIIQPPFWKTIPALIAYGVLLILALWVARRMVQNRERLTYRLQQEREEVKRLHDLDVLKVKFFTNVSHEFRTPLTLILAPLESMMQTVMDTEHKNQLQLIHRNAKRLLNLVNQLLDFRKMEVQEIPFKPVKADIISFIKDITCSFTDLAERKQIQFSFISPLEQLETFFDPDKLEKILFNLLSNAFKFTEAGGNIMVKLKITSALGNTDEPKQLQISVSDTGIGIAAENKDKIFKPFFQSELPGTLINQGSGIGLSITKKFVKQHGGSIGVKSKLQEGSCFIVQLPIADNAIVTPLTPPLPTPIPSLQPVLQPETISKVNEAHKPGKKPVVLLVEDNEDFRFYLKDHLKSYFTIHEAANGKDAWKLVLTLMPSLIVSDVMMPVMDGIELSKKLKKDPRTAHLPVILLTSNATQEQEIIGYETGANDYITKPFNFNILLSRIKNLIAQQARYQDALQQKLDVKPQDIAITSAEEKLVQTTIAVIEKFMADPEFSVEDLSRELGMSRAYLYKKLLAITGRAPLEFIRVIRLKRAAQLLKESHLSVSEVAYQVGFNNPKKFSSYFKLEFKCLPSVYAAENKLIPSYNKTELTIKEA